MKFPDAAEGSIKNTYLYNDKELFDDGGLNWYDYGFRSYDPQIGRFMQLDPLTDDYPELTPFQYASDDPITNIDVDGLEGATPLVDVGDAAVTAKSFLAPVVVKGLSKAQLAAKATQKAVAAAKATAKFAALQKAFTAFKITVNIADAIDKGVNALPLQKLTGPAFPHQAMVGPDRFPIRSKEQKASIKAIFDNAEKQEERDRREKADGYKLPIMGNLFTAINRVGHGDIGAAAKPGVLFGIDLLTIPAGGEEAGGEMVIRSLDDLSSMPGATWDEAETLIPQDWIRSPMKKGDGIKFVNPNKRGEQILLEKGWPGSTDPLHAGPYMKVSRDGKITRIPLLGNPALNP